VPYDLSVCPSVCLLQMVVNYAFIKEEMRRQGDQLDAKLRKATIELHALNNTLGVVKQRNHAQRLGRDIKPTRMLLKLSLQEPHCW